MKSSFVVAARSRSGAFMAPCFFADACHHGTLTVQRHKASATRLINEIDRAGYTPVEKSKQSRVEIVFKVILNSE